MSMGYAGAHVRPCLEGLQYDFKDKFSGLSRPRSVYLKTSAIGYAIETWG